MALHESENQHYIVFCSVIANEKVKQLLIIRKCHELMVKSATGKLLFGYSIALCGVAGIIYQIVNN